MEHPMASRQGITLYVKRDDKIHPRLSGNKYRKIKGHYKHFLHGGYSRIVAFGGAFSNLLHDLSFVLQAARIEGHFYIRGDAFDLQNPTLQTIRRNGISMHFLDRKEYRLNRDPDFRKHLESIHPGALIIPEGASGPFSLEGAGEIVEETCAQLGRVPDAILMDLGTGGTFAGVLDALPPGCRLTGIPVLKGIDWHRTLGDILGQRKLEEKMHTFTLLESYHFGGFARFNPELIRFINDFRRIYDIPLEPLYTGKLAWALDQLLQQGYFKPGSLVVWIHSGGLQGISGFNYRFGPLIETG